jgi:hypothetical protein
LEREYQLVLKGALDGRMGSEFAKMREFARMRLTCATGKTVLCGPVRNHAELQALLQQTHRLGLTLLSVTLIGASGRRTPSPRATGSPTGALPAVPPGCEDTPAHAASTRKRTRASAV